MLDKSLALCALIVLLLSEVYMLGVYAPGRIVAAGPHRTAVSDFGAGEPIAQTFTIPDNGLQEIRVLTSTPRSTRADLAWTLSVQRGTAWVPIISARRAVDLPAGDHWQAIRFPAVEDSAGSSYRLDLRLPRPGPDTQAIALAASLDDAHPGGFLAVNDQERWGDLVFETRATEDTVAGRFIAGPATALPRPLNSLVTWAGILAVLNGLLGRFVAGALRGALGHALPAPDTRRRPVSVAMLAVLIAAAAGTVAIGRRHDTRINLLDHLYEARMQVQESLHWHLGVSETSILGELQVALYAHPSTQVTWRVTVPPGGRLRASIGILPGAWGFPESDGVVFRAGVTEAGRYSELLSRHLNPAHVEADRRWMPIDVDLAPFAGRTIEISLSTDASVAGAPVNGAYDWAVWGSPRIAAGR
jgi:hypothetical protein